MADIKREKDYLFSFLLGPIFGFVMIFFLLMDSSVSAFEGNNALFLNLGLIKQFEEAREDADVSMILLGNSRLRYGSTFGFDPAALTTLPDGRNMASLQFARNAAEFKTYSEYTDRILLARPDYIVILDMLLTNSRPPDRSPVIKFSKMVYEAWMERWRGMEPQDAWQRARTDRQNSCYAYFTLDFMNNRIETTASRDRHSLDPEENANLALVREFIGKAVDRGIKVIVLHYPMNRSILDRFDVPYHYLDHAGIGYTPAPQDVLPETHDRVIWASYPEPLGPEYYCDFLHFNKKGRDVFSDWFLNVVAQDSRSS